MFKRIASVFLLTALLLISIPFSASAETTTLTQTVSSFNGTRYENYLVVYNYSGSNTGTNTYGYEVTVTNGVVTAVGGNNSYIPYSSGSSQSFVVSGHGTMATWLQENVVVGMKAEYSTRSYTVTFTSDSSTANYLVQAARNKALEAKNYAASACLVYDDTADTRFIAAEAKFDSLGSSVSDSAAAELAAEYETIAALYAEREVSEYRGLWLRPTQKSYSDVETYIRKCYQQGINMISIETMYFATMICPMPSGSYFEHNPSFNGFDVLDAFVTIGHRYGIEIHCWMPVFYSSMSSDTNYSRSPAYKKPEWQLKTNNGSALYSDETSGMVFLNPALSEVQDFLAETYTYILKNYDIDGFQLDYIRYRDRTTADDYGYDSQTISLFKTMYPQYRNYSITYNTRASYWNDWVAFRASKVTEFVERMRGIIDEVAPGVLLSADVGPSLDTAYSNYYQDSSSWMSEGWLDMIHPMAYGENYSPYIEPFFNYTGQNCAVVPGLGVFMDEFDADEMLEQTQEMKSIGCDGVVFFESVSFNTDKTGELLSETLYTQQALAPSRNNANTIQAIMERIKIRLDKAMDSGLITWQVCNDVTWVVNLVLDDIETNANAASGDVGYLKDTINQYVPDGDLKERLLWDTKKAMYASLRDNEIDTPEENILIDNTIPDNAVGSTQLVIDQVNNALAGEDSVLITDQNAAAYNTKYAYVMLLVPVEGKANTYKLVEARQNTGANYTFKTTLTSDMLIAGFHTDNVGSGVERRDLAKSIPIGTELVLYGVDLETNSFTSLNPMLYVPINYGIVDPGDAEYGDVNLDGIVDMFDYLYIKSVYFEKITVDSVGMDLCDLNDDGNVDMFDYLELKTLVINS